MKFGVYEFRDWLLRILIVESLLLPISITKGVDCWNLGVGDRRNTIDENRTFNFRSAILPLPTTVLYTNWTSIKPRWPSGMWGIVSAREQGLLQSWTRGTAICCCSNASVRKKRAWRRPIQGADTWFLRSLVLE